jgi:hypothetical protein
MQNVGVDAQLTYHGKAAGDKLKYNIGVVFGTYKNEILRVGNTDADFFQGGGSRLAGPSITRSLKGQPISSFWGYQIVGIFQDEAEVAAAPEQTDGGKKVGRWRFADLNKDKVVDDNDRTFIGNPHPDFTYGINIDLSWKNFDFSAFFQGSQGNDVFNYNRYWIDFETFNGNRSRETLTDSWTPSRRNASLPKLDVTDQVSNGFAHSYYVEDGSYLALRQAQLGYTFQTLGKMKVDRLRIYVQATNPIMITQYRGYNPAITTAGFGSGADATMGVDYGYYPLVKQFIFGANLSF